MQTKSHVLMAVFIAIAIALYMSFERVYLFGIIIGVLLPDIIEPPTSKWHRKFFHSKRFLRGLMMIMVLIFVFSFLIENLFWLFFVMLGYVMHLLGDLVFHGLPR